MIAHHSLIAQLISARGRKIKCIAPRIVIVVDVPQKFAHELRRAYRIRVVTRFVFHLLADYVNPKRGLNKPLLTISLLILKPGVSRITTPPARWNKSRCNWV